MFWVISTWNLWVHIVSKCFLQLKSDFQLQKRVISVLGVCACANTL